MNGFFYRREIGERQLDLYGFDIGKRIHVAADVYDVFIGEAAHHVHDAIGFANGGKEFVAQSFAFGCTGNEAGNIDEFDDGRLYLLRLHDFR